jgi:hypothetical protein
MSAVYPSFVDKVLAGDIGDLATVTLKAQLLGAYLYDASHSVLADLDHTIASPVTVAVDHIADGAVYLSPATVGSVAAGAHVIALALYVDDGATRPLAAYQDRRADRVLIDLTGNGGDIALSWPDYAFRL